MALFQQGMTCPLCGRPIDQGEGRVAFPPFVRNTRDPLWALSDAVVHSACLATHKQSAWIANVLNDLAQSDTKRLRCGECGEPVDRGDALGLGYLTADPEHPLFEFNYLVFHPKHFEAWQHRARYELLLEELSRSGEWR